MITLTPVRRPSAPRYATALALASTIHVVSCAPAARDGGSVAVEPVMGTFAADGSCQATVRGVALFAATDRQHATYDAGGGAGIAPAGFTLHQLACAPADAAPGAPDRSGDRLVLVALYVPTGSSLRPGRFVVRAGIGGDGDTTGIASRAGIAIFGARDGGSASRAGVRYLEAREGVLDVTAVDGARVVARFDVRAGEAWSM
jgi:hypothetical protein